MKCPRCSVAFHNVDSHSMVGSDADGGWVLRQATCPTCNRLILHLMNGEPAGNVAAVLTLVKQEILVWPKASSRPPCPVEVPKDLAEDYMEACLVLADSPKASAALSRRCLQHLLREAAKVKPGDLAHEIQEVIDSKALPSYLITMIDAVRNIGNFAAHPMKSRTSGEILPVETGEAEWNLDVLEALFDFYFVQPAVIQAKRDALNQKLQEAGKPPMK